MVMNPAEWEAYLRLTDELGVAEWESRERALGRIFSAPREECPALEDATTLRWGQLRSILTLPEEVRSFYLWLRDTERLFFEEGVYRWDLECWLEERESGRKQGEEGRVGVWAQMQSRSERAALGRAEGEVQEPEEERRMEERASDLVIRDGEVREREEERCLSPARTASYLQRYRAHVARVQLHLALQGFPPERLERATAPLREYLRELEEAYSPELRASQTAPRATS